jgi:FkbM family methyltransferase
MFTLKTRYKIAFARIVYRMLSTVRGATGRGSEIEVTRRGIRWKLDLREGIDLSIFLFGSFEPSTVRTCEKWIQPGATALDIGANIGAHTLHMARLVGPQGQVIAFEPTQFAYDKLLANRALNPELASRVVPEQVFLVDTPNGKPSEPVYSSWPLDAQPGLHPEHQGKRMDLDGAKALTLDDYVAERGLERLDFIKLDVDGYEPVVLRGATRTLARFKPVIVLELAPYQHEDTGLSFADTLSSLCSHGYSLRDEKTGIELPTNPTKIAAMIPRGASRNVIARVLDTRIPTC